MGKEIFFVTAGYWGGNPGDPPGERTIGFRIPAKQRKHFLKLSIVHWYFPPNYDEEQTPLILEKTGSFNKSCKELRFRKSDYNCKELKVEGGDNNHKLLEKFLCGIKKDGLGAKYRKWLDGGAENPKYRFEVEHEKNENPPSFYMKDID